MKFRAERDVLLEALATAARAAATRGGGHPALSGVRLEATGDVLRLAGSDLDLTIQVEAAIAGIDDGVCVIPARLGTDIIRALEPGAVTFSLDGGEAQIAAGRSQFTVRVLPAEEFLRLPEPAGDAVDTRCRRPVRGPEPGGSGCEQGRCPPDPRRRAHDRRSVRPAAGRHRLLPPGLAGPARHHGVGRGSARARARTGTG